MTTSTRRPIQVYLDDRQDKALRRLAVEQDTSISDLIRRGIDLLLAGEPAESDSAWALLGIGASDVTDLGARHDDYLADALGGKSTDAA